MNAITPSSGVADQGTSTQIEQLDFKAFEQASKTEQAGQNRATLAAAFSAAGLPASPQDIELGRRMYEVAQAQAKKSGQTLPPFEAFAKSFASQLKEGGEEYRKTSWLAVQAFYGGRYAPPEYQATPEQLQQIGVQVQPGTGPLVAPPPQDNGQPGTVAEPVTSDVPPPAEDDVPPTTPQVVAPTNQSVEPPEGEGVVPVVPQQSPSPTNTIVPGVVNPDQPLTPREDD